MEGTSAMKRYMRKKLPNFQVHRVMSRTKQGQEMMQQLREPFILSGVPSGFYVIEKDSILLPNRKRGEKFIVHYTVMNEAIL